MRNEKYAFQFQESVPDECTVGEGGGAQGYSPEGLWSSVSDPYSFFPDPDPEIEDGDQSGSGSNPDPGFSPCK